MSLFTLLNTSANPHHPAIYDYSFRLKPGTSIDFRDKIHGMIDTANGRLEKIYIDQEKKRTAYEFMHIDKTVLEVLVGPAAGLIHLEWRIQGISLLPLGGSTGTLTAAASQAVEQIAQVVAEFDGGLRSKYMDPMFPSDILVLGRIEQVSSADVTHVMF